MPWLADPIESDRLILRAFRTSDRALLTALLRNPDVRVYLGGPLTTEQVLDALSRPMGERWGAFCVVRRDTREPIGSCSLSRDRGDLEIQYQLLPEHWGQGFAREAVLRIIDWVWETTTESRLIAVTQAAHKRSRSLLEGIGMVATGEFDEYGARQVRYDIARPDHAE